MTTTPNEPVRDEDIETIRAAAAGTAAGPGDADATDGTAQDSDGSDGGDADGTDSGDADGTDGGDADSTDA